MAMLEREMRHLAKQAVQENARLKDLGLAVALELTSLMGLRLQEAVHGNRKWSAAKSG